LSIDLQSIREIVKEIDQAAKEAATALQVIHSDISKSELEI
jgi:hypothetical protein